MQTIFCKGEMITQTLPLEKEKENPKTWARPAQQPRDGVGFPGAKDRPGLSVCTGEQELRCRSPLPRHPVPGSSKTVWRELQRPPHQEPRGKKLSKTQCPGEDPMLSISDLILG